MHAAHRPRRRDPNRPRSSSDSWQTSGVDGRAGAHRDRDPALVGHFDGALVAGVDVADHAHAGIVGEYPFELLGGEVGAVGDADLTGVDRAADADATSVVDAHPRGARTRVD